MFTLQKHSINPSQEWEADLSPSQQVWGSLKQRQQPFDVKFLYSLTSGSCESSIFFSLEQNVNGELASSYSYFFHLCLYSMQKLLCILDSKHFLSLQIPFSDFMIYAFCWCVQALPKILANESSNKERSHMILCTLTVLMELNTERNVKG